VQKTNVAFFNIDNEHIEN